MPIYEYRCEACGLDFEVLQKISDPILESREGCLESACNIRKKFSSFAGHIAGKIAPPSDHQEPSSELSFTPALPANDPIHVCSKYCHHHTRNRDEE